NPYFTSIYIFNRSWLLSNHRNPRVMGSLVVNTSTYQWSMRIDQRNSLSLHVSTHQCTVGVIVFKEWDTCRGNRNNLLRRNIHVVNVFNTGFDVVIFITSHYLIVNK